MNVSRRQFVRRLFWSGAALGIGGVGYAWEIEPRRLDISHIPVRIPGLPRAWNGLKVAHLTDLHRSRYVSARYLKDCIARVNELEPDLVLFTGDYLSHWRTPRGRMVYDHGESGEEIMTDCAAIIGKTRARYGVFASLGNHDHWFDAGFATRAIETVGISVLRNACRLVRINGEDLPVVGLGDLWTEGVNFPRAFAGVDAPFALVMMHNPDSFENWSQSGAQLILSGHTHGGQVNVPFLGPPLVPSRYGAKYASGLFHRGDAQMYVSRGVGLIAPPVRLNCPPEIPVLHLQHASA